MSRSQRMRTMWCKKARVSPATDTLQKMLSAKLGGDVIDRLENTSPDPESGTFQVIAQNFPVGRGIAGIFTSYVPGASAVSVEIARGTKQLDLAQLRPPKSADTNKVREWAEGLLYFFCRDDYVVVIQSSSVRIGQFEEHLSWLLRAPGERIGPAVELIDRPAKSVASKVRHSHIKTIRVGGALLKPAPDQADTARDSKQFRVVGTSMLEAMRSALFHDSAGFDWDAAFNGNLKATLLVTYDRNTTTKGQKLLDDIGLAFRGHDDVDTEIRLSTGQKISGNNLRLTTSAKILADDGVLVPDSAFSAMQSWFIDLAESGELN